MEEKLQYLKDKEAGKNVIKPKLFFENETFKLYHGSNLEVLPTLPDNSVDSIVTDPPYELGFMGKGWDATGIAYNEDLWKECLRVLKPGGHLLAFSASRTYHWMAVAIEKAGFEIRDQIMWLYGSGFPKALDVAKSIDKEKGFECEAKQWDGWKSALKPAHEPIVLARKPLEKGLTIAQNILKWGVGALNIDESRIGFDMNDKNPATNPLYRAQNGYKKPQDNGQITGDVIKFTNSQNPVNEQGRFPANIIHDGSQEVKGAFPDSKPSKSSNSYLMKNPSQAGVVHEKSEIKTIRGHDDNGGSAARFFYGTKAQTDDRDQGLEGYEEINIYQETEQQYGYGNENGDNLGERMGMVKRKNIHPTVKPTDLMRYLVRMVTPKNGTVLDPFFGSGSTGKGAMVENIINNKDYKIIGIELGEDERYLPIARDRVKKGAKIYAHNELYGKPKKVKVDENQLTLF